MRFESPYAGVVLSMQAGVEARWRLDLGGNRPVPLAGGDGHYRCGPIGRQASANLVMRFALAAELAPRGGVVLHAAGVASGGRGYLFLGRSGAGKTTISTRAEGTLLSDDTVVILPGANAPVVWGTPFVSDGGRPGSIEAVPVGGIVTLRWGPLETHALSERAVLRALYQAVFLPPDPALVAAVTPTLLSLAARVSGAELSFPLHHVFRPCDLADAR